MENGSISHMTDFSVKEDYFHWLASLVDTDPNRDYKGLLMELHSIEFSNETARLIPNDDNRIEDGIALRDRFKEETGCKACSYLNGPCTVLEMLVALAYRIEDVIGNNYVYSFWEMLGNLNLDKYDDDTIDELGNADDIDDHITELLNRTYSRNGVGGLFPLDHPSKDQRKVEIWYQMGEYLVEKYM